MKKTIKSYQLNIVPLLFAWAILISCSKEEELKPVIETPKKSVEVINIPGISGSSQIITRGTKSNETPNGYDLEGTVSVINENGDTLDLGDGDYIVSVDDDGNFIDIIGEALANFPDVGIFRDLRKELTWEFSKAHVEYKTGKYYKEAYATEIPLNDERYYWHFKIFDEDKDERFNLRNKANEIIYGFYDFYLDTDDPAVFFKMSLWKPSFKDADELSEKLMKKILERAKELGSNVKELNGAPGLIIGISNQGLIKSQTYDFNFNPKFEALYGDAGFEEIESHLFLKFIELPIPETVILQFTGDAFQQVPLSSIGEPLTWTDEEKKNQAIEWLTKGKYSQSRMSYNGIIDFGNKGIGNIVGALPKVNDVLGYEIFNRDINIDLLGATLQYQQKDPSDINQLSLFRLGFETNVPLIHDILGEGLAGYFPSKPDPEAFFYLSIDNDINDWSIFMEQKTSLSIPYLGDTELNNSHFILNSDSIYFEVNFSRPSFGILDNERTYIGSASHKYGYRLYSEFNSSINFPNGTFINPLEMKIDITSTKGTSIFGKAELPLGITDAWLNGHLTSEKVSFEGEFKSALDLDLGFDLSSRDMTINVSSDPDEGMFFTGQLEVPHLGYNAVTGILNKSEAIFKGTVNRTLDFAGVNLPLVNGSLNISNTSGINLYGQLTLPAGLNNAAVAGIISPDEMKFSGKMASSITIAGYPFAFSNSAVTASTNTGVAISGAINLKRFTANINGQINPDGTFVLTGSRSYNTELLKLNINVKVTESGISLTGNGTVYVKGILGNLTKVYEGNITFVPNWNNGTIQACYNSVCVNI